VADPAVVALVVIDNAADDATARAVRSVEDDRVAYLASANDGFAGGCNAGVAALAAPVEWLAFVNPDVELERGLGELVGMPVVARACVVGAHVESPRSPGVPSAARRVTVRRELTKAVVGSRAYPSSPWRTRRFGSTRSRVRCCSCGGDFARRNGFDARFELYYEDIDLCNRAAALGGCVFVPVRWGRHVGGASAAAAAGPHTSRVVSAGWVPAQACARAGHRRGAAGHGRPRGRGADGGAWHRGDAARVTALRAQVKEWRRPGSARALRPGP